MQGRRLYSLIKVKNILLFVKAVLGKHYNLKEHILVEKQKSFDFKILGTELLTLNVNVSSLITSSMC